MFVIVSRRRENNINDSATTKVIDDASTMPSRSFTTPTTVDDRRCTQSPVGGHVARGGGTIREPSTYTRLKSHTLMENESDEKMKQF